MDRYSFDDTDSEQTPTQFLFPAPSPSSTASSTPVPSRSTSPLPELYPPQHDDSNDDSDSDPDQPLVLHHRGQPWAPDVPHPWWSRNAPRRPPRRWHALRAAKRRLRRILRHPFFPGQPITIILTLILFSVFAISLTLLLMYILNPDKEPLPWRAYCSVPSLAPPFDRPAPPNTPHVYPNVTFGQTAPAFPHETLDTLPPAGILLGVFSIDSAFERRMLVRTTWASHPRSRDGAGAGDHGDGTSRTIVRFVLGQPRKDWERRVRLEIETYNDIIILPISENMNSGKSHKFFSWAALSAWVPPVYKPSIVPPPVFSYSNATLTPPPLAPHDPYLAWQDASSASPRPWVRPDYVVKVDDDSFVMLAELEARLRLALHSDPRNDPATPSSREIAAVNDPLIYWGYLVTNRLHMFMAGELYALSWSLVDWAAKDPTVQTLTRGKEDKQTAQWMRAHPRASEVRWTSERCWIYDHPRSGTVYSHGYLFPSEVARVKKAVLAELEHPNRATAISGTTATAGLIANGTPTVWGHSSVSTFGVRYTPPLTDLTAKHSVEALVEGSDMSLLREGSPMTPEYAWTHREGRRTRYEGKRVGGTVVVHFIKKNMWYLETALAMLEGAEESEAERYESGRATAMPRS